MPSFTKKIEEVVAYDSYTRLKHSAYKTIYLASEMLDISTKEIAYSIRDNSYVVSGLYFKKEPRRSFSK
jgi:hypothetical protein